jgi:23S rRNA (guanosine2251-2'-O)-methyltransferase
VIAEASAVRARSWREGVERARSESRVPLVIALDGIEDPQNVGALLRSAEVFGVDAVLVPKRRSAPLGPAVAKASAGAIEHLVIDPVNSLERALASCREDGLWIVALAAEGTMDVRQCELLSEPVVIVVGAEDKGVSTLVRGRADVVVQIPVRGRVASLNASVAGAICLWEAARRRTPAS